MAGLLACVLLLTFPFLKKTVVLKRINNNHHIYGKAYSCGNSSGVINNSSKNYWYIIFTIKRFISPDSLLILDSEKASEPKFDANVLYFMEITR